VSGDEAANSQSASFPNHCFRGTTTTDKRKYVRLPERCYIVDGSPPVVELRLKPKSDTAYRIIVRSWLLASCPNFKSNPRGTAPSPFHAPRPQATTTPLTSLPFHPPALPNSPPALKTRQRTLAERTHPILLIIFPCTRTIVRTRV
jgi:hypothetical protein